MEVDVLELVGELRHAGVGDDIGKVLVQHVGDGHLGIDVRLGGSGVVAEPGHNVRERCDILLGELHQRNERLTNHGVEDDDDREGDQRPQAAGHRVDLGFLIELGDLFLILLLVGGVTLLQLLHAGREHGGAHHAVLALHLEGQHDELHEETEEKDRSAVAVADVVEEQQHGAENFDHNHRR